MIELKALIGKIATGATLAREEAAAAFEMMMSGEATPSQMGAFLMALRLRGETVEEITGAVTAMRAKMLRVEAPPDAIDVVGTGGAQAGIGFMFAPAHHPATKHVAATRVELGTRTIFNMLGPLSNPAGVKRQMVGVFARQWVEPLAHVLKNLGSERAYVVHGSDGLDEITTVGPTHAAVLENGVVRVMDIAPEEFGFKRSTPEALRGGDAATNAAALRAVLQGQKTPLRDVAILNAAAALDVAGRADGIAGALPLAQNAIDSGAAARALERLVAVSNAPA
ncbi:MAG: anthranilate phosphoribosyltransferase [Proteobacteria bacterium]|nr:anthranilate phosphoribosyltransferase [Pseudomonadota bacterium]